MSFNFTPYQNQLLFVPLGGSNEIGMNLNLYTIHGKWLMVDCGIGFAHEYYPGIDVIVPDISFVVENKENLLGLVLTHAHEDHIGAIPYLWREFECPIYATKFTASFLRHKFGDMGPGAKPKITDVKPGAPFDIGPFHLEMIHLTHSIPEMQALAITAGDQVVMHTGDWKFDADPKIGPASDTDALARYGAGGVDALVCDSTNVFVEGESGSEADVRVHLTEVIRNCENRVVVTTFASNLARLETIILAAREAGRLIALAGRSLHRMVETAREVGYLDKGIEFINDREVMNLARKDICIICTGNQGEPRAALTRMARGDHPTIRLSPKDTVIFSSRKIPGNEMRINWMMNKLSEHGVDIITDSDSFIHVSGHPARDELKRMYELVKPKIAIPTHGERRHIHEHCRLARQWGAAEAVEAQNGVVISLEPGNAGVIGKVQSGYVAVDGSSLIPADSDIIRTRRKLRDDGAAFVSVVLNKDGRVLGVKLSMPGVLIAKEDAELIEQLEHEIADELATAKPRADDVQLKELVHIALRRGIRRELDKKPVVEVALLRV